MRHYHLLLALSLLLLSSCRNARLAFRTYPLLPAAADLQVHSAAVPMLAHRQPVSPTAASPASFGLSSGFKTMHRPRINSSSSLPSAHYQLRPPHTAPAGTLPRQAAKSKQLGHPEPRTGWAKWKHFLGRLLAWTVYLTLVGLAGWLVYVVVKWGFALDVLGIVFGGIPLFLLTLLLFYFVMVFGGFAIVSEVPM